MLYLSCVGGVDGVDNTSRRDLAVHVRNGRINSEGAFRIPVGMGRWKSVHGRNMAGVSSEEPQIVEICGYGESGRGFVISAFEQNAFVSLKRSMRSGASFLPVFDFLCESFCIRTSHYVIQRVIYLGCVRGVGVIDS